MAQASCCDSDLHAAGHDDMHDRPRDVQSCDTVSVVQHTWRSNRRSSHPSSGIHLKALHSGLEHIYYIMRLLSQLHKTLIFLTSCIIFHCLCEKQKREGESLICATVA